MAVKVFSLKKDGDLQLTPNFKVREFACKDGSDKILIDVDFVINFLQKIRDYFAKPMTINSGHRTEAYNTKIKGSKNSYHIKGMAFDIVISGVTPLQIAQFAETLGITGIIQYNTFTHIDCRPVKYWARDNAGKITQKTTFKLKQGA